MSNNTKTKYDQAFDEALGMLNQQQFDAVKQTEGPIMVMAGPGTGKTQLLGVRVGYILQNTDAKAHNILCLTFTNAGAVSMRSRLLSFIGPEAYNAHIYTYHAFCHSVIQDNIEYFGGYRELQLISDIEQIEILNQIIDELPKESLLKRFKGDLYYDRNNLLKLFSTMKQENWKSDMVDKNIADYEIEMREDESMIYKNSRKGKWEKGDFKQAAFDKFMEKYRKTKEAVALLGKYDQLLYERQRYDQQDTILFVIDAFEKNENLKLDYQERYQYILVDEYQDTNGSQNDLVFLLSDYWEKPNLFVVGDDDQAIYRFQGANMTSLTDFISKFTPDRYVLKNNYRSYQGILDSAYKLIRQNSERIGNQTEVKNEENDPYKLVESREDRKGYGSEPIVYKYQKKTLEQAGLVSKILELHEQGVAYKNMAVIYRGHKSATDLVKYFTLKDIPLQIKRKVNVLDLPEVKKIHNIMLYLAGEYSKQDSREDLLFEILHYSYFKIAPRDIGYIAAHCSNYADVKEDDRKWRKVIGDEEQLQKLVQDSESILNFSVMLEDWIGSIPNMTLQRLFEKVITQSGLLNDILMDEDKTFRLQVLNKYFDLIKNESAKNPDFTLDTLIANVDIMRHSNISLPLEKVIQNEDGINFMTAHGSKGLEFDYVFIVDVTKKNWEQKNAGRGFRFPPDLVPISETSDIQDDRRLFYVALTRAKNFAYISYSLFDDEGKDLETARFISELGEHISAVDGVVSNEQTEDYVTGLMTYTEGTPVLIDRDLVSRLLKTFSMSATALNKFIRCRWSFYFENLLRVPMARSATMGYGSAIHYALEMYFKTMEADPERKSPDPDTLTTHFIKGMKIYRSHFTQMEFDNFNILGEKILREYYDEYRDQWNTAKQTISEKNIKHTSIGEIPIKGKIDKVEVYDDHVKVIDYKTGTYKKDKLAGVSDEDQGGDYWRQLVFYKLLVDNDPTLDWKMKSGTMDFVEKAKTKVKYDKIELPISPQDEEAVTKQLQESWTAIHNYEFEQFCEDENCRWCNFVRDTSMIQPVELDESYNEE